MSRPSRRAGVAAMAAMIPTNWAKEGTAAAVARSESGNQRAPTLVMAFITKGWPTARPTWETKTQVKLDPSRPRARPNTPVSTAPIPNPIRRPYVSMMYEAGIDTTTNTTMKAMESRPIRRSETP